MANVLGELFQNIADAIRSKTGSTDTLKPNQFPEAIEGITTGGGEGEKPFDCHSVTFVYNDKSYVRSVADGDTCADPVERGLIPTPTKESTAQYNYTFYGWGASDGGAADANILKNITADKTVYAIFTSTVRYYTITWLDSDGVTELPGQKQWAYGTIPSYTPTKEGFAFDKWTPTPTEVTGNASYSASWSSVIGAGVLDTGLAWKLTADGVFTISGEGEVPNFASRGERPWHNYVMKIKAITFLGTVTSIGNYAFNTCTNLTSVAFPGTVTSIGDYAFGSCTNLTSIDLGAVDSLGFAAFSDCRSLTSITIPDSVTKIGRTAFSASGLTSVTIGSQVSSIGAYAFNTKTLTYAKFNTTSGWYVTTTEGATSGTTLSSTNLANTSTAATYLNTTYLSNYWYRK